MTSSLLPDWLDEGWARVARDRELRRFETHDWDDLSEFEQWLRTKAYAMRLAPTGAEGKARIMLEDMNPDTEIIPQAVIGRYIVDFLFPAKKVVVEIDGSVHRSEFQQAKDLKRTRWLERHGYQVRRLTNEDIEAHWYEWYGLDNE